MKFFAGLLVVLVILGGVIGTVISYHNTAVRMETNIKKFDRESQNVLSNYTNKLQEKAQIPEMYKNDLSEIVDKTFKGRYGADGSKAVFQFIKETMPNFDSSLYKDLQITIEAGRNDFRLSQSRKLDICQQYESMTGQFPASYIFSVTGKGYANVEQMCQIIVDESTSTKFKTGVDKAIKLR